MDTGQKTRSGTPAGLSVRRVPLSTLKADPANARLHGERNLAAIVASLERFGQAEPLVVNARTGRLIAGHGRVEAMRKLGWQAVDIVEVDLPEIDAVALGIALNRTSELAEWNQPALIALIEQLKAEDALGGVGFEQVEIDEIVASIIREGDPFADIAQDLAPGLPDQVLTAL